ncbi:type II toxin-antitoxin system prevent-host-death family antitoxin [Candidatus Bipolaricaulota bacterium]|nr:type II toxin-antitoxin system prevent-host-death family antitoxin [Candidatus Bipolaricaulota bacterium]MCK4580149.1 type II toxin-antitoxin system prevent-host-death family antitoxin [Dehalococcoidia bacterium]
MSLSIKGDQMVTSSEVGRHFGEFLARVKEGELIVLRHGRPEAVLVDFKRYEALHKELEELGELVDHLNLYLEIQERKGDRVLSAEEAASELGLGSDEL